MCESLLIYSFFLWNDARDDNLLYIIWNHKISQDIVHCEYFSDDRLRGWWIRPQLRQRLQICLRLIVKISVYVSSCSPLRIFLKGLGCQSALYKISTDLNNTPWTIPTILLYNISLTLLFWYVHTNLVPSFFAAQIYYPFTALCYWLSKWVDNAQFFYT